MKYIIIGTGNICKTYIKAIGNLPDSTITGFISRSGKSPEGGTNLPVWTVLKEVDKPFNAVIITSPNGLHHKHAIEAATLGKHVLTEKPLDITIEAMERMTDCCRKNRVQLSVAFQRRMNPDNLAIKKLISEKKLGRIFAVDLSCKFWRTQEYYDSGDYRGAFAIDGGGPFMQQAVHNLDLYQWLFGMPQTIKSMMGTFRHDIEVEDHGAALMGHENGMIGTIIASTATSPGFKARMEVHSDKGYFITTDDKITTWDIEGVSNPGGNTITHNDGGLNSAAVSDSSLHEAVLRDFESSITDKRAPLISPESAALTTQLILKIYENARL